MRLKVFYFVALMIMAFVAGGCTGRTDNGSNTDNPAKSSLLSLTAKSAGVPEVSGLNPGDIPLCYSPDLKNLYVMNYSRPVQEMKVIFGDYSLPVDLYRVANGRRTKLVADIPFITLAQWSPGRKFLGISGGEQLYILNAENDSLDSVNKLVNLPSAVFLGWSPDGKTVYAEHDHVPNGAVFNVETREGLPSYKIKERIPFF